MTINDLKKVYVGRVVVTVLGYLKNGKYYSFYTYTDGDEYKIPIGNVNDYTAGLEIKRIWCLDDVLSVDVIDIIDNDEEEL